MNMFCWTTFKARSLCKYRTLSSYFFTEYKEELTSNKNEYETKTDIEMNWFCWITFKVRSLCTFRTVSSYFFPEYKEELTSNEKENEPKIDIEMT